MMTLNKKVSFKKLYLNLNSLLLPWHVWSGLMGLNFNTGQVFYIKIEP